MTDDDLTRRTARLLAALEDALPSEALASLSVVVATLINHLPAAKRPGITESWFELVRTNVRVLAPTH